MQINLRHNPSFAVARMFLAPGEPVQVESGAMMAHSPGVQISSKAAGGVMQGLKRSVLAGEASAVRDIVLINAAAALVAVPADAAAAVALLKASTAFA